MIRIEEALLQVNTQPVNLSIGRLPLNQSVGFWLAEDISSSLHLPPFDNSAMDGYAVSGRHARYLIKGEVAAGDTGNKQLNDGEALRIFTGGKVPENTTAVIMQEKTDVTGKTLLIEDSLQEGQNIRKKGSELEQHQQVFSKGKQLTPATVGLIASLGVASVKVYLKPRVSLISTGNELIPPGQPLKEGQIYESNSWAIESVLNQYGFAGIEKEHVRDDYQATKEVISKHLASSDLLLLSGGISVGDYDFVKQALEENGVEQIFYKVAQKPGKPLYFGKKDHQFIFALPGNPASSLTCFYLYVLPFLQRMSGAIETGLLKVRASLHQDFELKGDRPAFLKARLDRQEVSILDGQSSSMIHSLALANSLALIQPGKTLRGDSVDCFLIN